MAITSENVLTGVGDTSNTTSYNTAVASPGANRLLMFFVICNFGSSAPDFSISGGPSVSWEIFLNSTTLSANRRIKVYVAISGPSPGSGAINISSETSMTGCAWFMTSFVGTYLGSSALDSLYGLAGSSNSGVTFVRTPPGTEQASGDATASVFSSNQNSAITSEQTEICDVGHASPAQRLGVQWFNGNDTDGPTFTSVSGTHDAWSWHIRDAANPPPPTEFIPYPVTTFV